MLYYFSSAYLKNFKKSPSDDIIEILKKSISLLQGETPENIASAEKLISELLKTQDNDPKSEHYGLWMQKEILSCGITNTYDQNMTTYIGIPLFIILSEYYHLLSERIIKKIEHALSIACIFIMHRNIHLQYTHIAIAESFLTAACGERFHSAEFTNYALNLFQHFYHYNIAQGDFIEYNTPEYDINNLCILYLAKKYIKNALFLQLTELISDNLWEIAATHYHYQSNNFAGPLFRNCEIFTPDYITQFFLKSCKANKQKNDVMNFYDICPQKYRPYFNGTKRNEYMQKIVSQGSSYPYYCYSRIATTLIKPNYCIGTFCRGECWLEQSAFLGYFGTRKYPFAVKITTLHDGYEYSSAQLSMVQHINYILGHTSFATNRGDRHIDHDSCNGIINAKDLRIRFLIAGDISRLSVSQSRKTINICYDGVYIKFTYSLAKFDGYTPKVELNYGETLNFDLILYQGKKKKINFNEMKKAISAWMFCISDDTIPDFKTENKFEKNYLITKTCTDTQTELMLKSYFTPDTHENIHVNNKQYIQGVLFEKYVQQNSNMMQQYSYIIDFNPISPLNIEVNDNQSLSELIIGLKKMPEEDIILSVKEIFSLMYKNKITLILVKRFAIQIISQIFEYYREKNIAIEMIIQNNSPIYLLRISSAPDTESVAYHVFELLQLIHSNYITLTESSKDADLIEKITLLIDEQFSNPNLSREYVAEQCGTSIFAISRAFKKISNLTYIDYLTNIRIEQAKKLLKNSKLSLNDIAANVGYINLSSFIRTFKKKTGETPSKYRNTV